MTTDEMELKTLWLIETSRKLDIKKNGASDKNGEVSGKDNRFMVVQALMVIWDAWGLGEENIYCDGNWTHKYELYESFAQELLGDGFPVGDHLT